MSLGDEMANRSFFYVMMTICYRALQQMTPGLVRTLDMLES